MLQKCSLFAMLVATAVFSFRLLADDRPVNWSELPEPYATPSARNAPMLVGQPDGVELALPEGFVVEPFITGMVSPRYMIHGPSGEILVSDMHVGKVYVIQGRERTLLLSGLDTPYGLAFYEDWLYVAETDSLKRYRYDKAMMRIVSMGEEIMDMSDVKGGHRTRSIAFGPENQWLYVSIGSKSNVDAGEPPRRAAITRIAPDGSEEHLFATGIRNGVGLRFHPESRQLWVTSHERDGLGDDLVPDYLTSVEQDDFFGWPYAYIGPHEDPRRAGEAPELVKQTRYPDVLLGSHVGALDVLFYTGSQFPDKYQGGAFVALHGSWNRSERVGYKLVFVPFEDGKPTAGPEDFLTGWMLSPNRSEVWGRPVGLLQMSDGSLLVSDDAGGKIWRIRYIGT